MRLAIIADVHGNADALIATLADIKTQSPDATVNLGDCFSGPLDAARTAELLHGADITATVRGNHDRYLLGEPAQMGPSDIHAHTQLSPQTLAWLASLPPTQVIDDIFLCHATPQDDTTYWAEDITPDGTTRRAPLATIAGRAETVAQSLVLCGHSHIARHIRLPDGRQLVNPGAVGCPAYTDIDHVVSAGHPFASYAVLDRTPLGWAVAHRHIPYDSTRMATLARAAQRPDWAEALATGWITRQR